MLLIFRKWSVSKIYNTCMYYLFLIGACSHGPKVRGKFEIKMIVHLNIIIATTKMNGQIKKTCILSVLRTFCWIKFCFYLCSRIFYARFKIKAKYYHSNCICWALYTALWNNGLHCSIDCVAALFVLKLVAICYGNVSFWLIHRTAFYWIFTRGNKLSKEKAM